MIDINSVMEMFQTQCIHSYKTYENLHLKLQVLSFPTDIKAFVALCLHFVYKRRQKYVRVAWIY